MKLFHAGLAVVLAAVFVADAVAAPPPTAVTTTAGVLDVRGADAKNQCQLLLAGKPLRRFDCEFAFTPLVLAHFKGGVGKLGDVVIVQEMPMGNACNGGPLHLIGINGADPVTMREIPFCGGADPVVARLESKVVITLPGGQANHGDNIIPAEVWTFENGNLSKAPASTSLAVPSRHVVMVGGLRKWGTATLRAAVAGDAACYLTLEDEGGRRVEELAVFAICEKSAALLNRRVRLTWAVEKVMHEDCQGNTDCKKTRQQVLVNTVTAFK